MWKKIKPYLLPIAIALGVGGLSALLTRDSMDIYKDIKLPPLAPPSFLFPIVWTILFTLMGISSAIILQKKDESPELVRSALTVYGASLAVNFFWSIIFFNLRAFLFSFVWLLLLIFLVITTIRLYKRIDKLAAYLQIPYLAWILFAAYLNLGIFLLNM